MQILRRDEVFGIRWGKRVLYYEENEIFEIIFEKKFHNDNFTLDNNIYKVIKELINNYNKIGDTKNHMIFQFYRKFYMSREPNAYYLWMAASQKDFDEFIKKYI